MGKDTEGKESPGAKAEEKVGAAARAKEVEKVGQRFMEIAIRVDCLGTRRETARGWAKDSKAIATPVEFRDTRPINARRKRKEKEKEE